MEFETLIVHWEWKGFFLLLLAAGFYWCIRQRSARQRHVFLLSALFGLLLIPLVDRWGTQVSSSRYQLMEPSSWQNVGLVLEGGLSRFGAGEISETIDAAPDLTFGPKNSKIQPVAEDNSVSVKQSLSWRWDVAWFAGVCLMLARSGLQYLNLLKLVRSARSLKGSRAESMINQMAASMGMKTVPQLLESERLTVPATWGWFRPYIGLPLGATAWPVETLRMVLEHECMHVRRRDYILQQFAGIIHALSWCNPMSWWAIRRLNRDMELACDEQVIARGTSPSQYAQTLLDVAQLATGSSANAAAVLMASTSNVQRRIEAALTNGKGVESSRSLRNWVHAVGVLSLAVFIGWQATLPIVAKGGTESADVIDAETGRRLKLYFQSRFERSKRFIDEQSIPLSNDSELFDFYQFGSNGDWQEALTLANKLMVVYRDFLNSESEEPEKIEYRLLHETVLYQPFRECHKALEACQNWSSEDIAHLVQNTIGALPEEDGVLFWDERAGGGVLSLYAETRLNSAKILLIELNSLTDNRYLEYLRASYGDGIRLPSDSDLAAVYGAYMREAVERHRAGQSQEGEEVSVLGDGHINIQGPVAAMGVVRHVIEWMVDQNVGVPIYFAGSSSIPDFKRRLQSVGYLTALLPTESGVSNLSSADHIHSEWRAFLGETEGVVATREVGYKLLKERIRSSQHGDQTSSVASSSASGRAWSSLRMSQALTLMHKGGANDDTQDLPVEALKIIDEALMQAWIWDPGSEAIKRKYLRFLKMVGEVEWGKRFSSLSL